MIALLMAGSLAFAAGQASAGAPPVEPDSGTQQSAVQLEDVVVSGRTLERMIREFVVEVAEPNRDRGLARWDSRICVGVANLSAEAAGYIADRVATVAGDIGLDVAGPGCAPNILVVATDDAGALAANLVGERARAFRMGGAGMDRGGAALRDFVATDRPVRWWQMSMPVDSETGGRAVRLPGDCEGDCTAPLNMAPIINVTASRLRTQIVDNIVRAIVLIDVDDVSNLSVLQLADYIAMVSLAQIDPDADTSGYASILNVFQDPQASASLTDWDLAYLGGLYGAERNQTNLRAGRSEIVESIRAEHSALRETEAPVAAAETPTSPAVSTP